MKDRCVPQFLPGTEVKSAETTHPLKVKVAEGGLKQNILIYFGTCTLEFQLTVIML